MKILSLGSIVSNTCFAVKILYILLFLLIITPDPNTLPDLSHIETVILAEIVLISAADFNSFSSLEFSVLDEDRSG